MSEPGRILLAHGGGGALFGQLLDEVILKTLGSDTGSALGDSAALDLSSSRIAFTSDSFVVQPLFFPGGDIGRLAVAGTVNDLAVAGAKPVALSLALILEEGFLIADLQKILASVRACAEEAGVSIVTGDTKVLPRGEANGLFINTAGIGLRYDGVLVSPDAAEPGDTVILSGEIAAHGVTIVALRNQLTLESSTLSDVAPLGGLVERIVTACARVKMMRDPTRGGLAATLNEIAAASNVSIELDEAAVPIATDVRRLCDLLGLDPLEVANEGKAVVIAPAEEAGPLVAAMQQHPLGTKAAVIGRVIASQKNKVFLNTQVGGRRLIEMPYGESLPRIC